MPFVVVNTAKIKAEGYLGEIVSSHRNLSAAERSLASFSERFPAARIFSVSTFYRPGDDLYRTDVFHARKVSRSQPVRP